VLTLLIVGDMLISRLFNILSVAPSAFTDKILFHWLNYFVVVKLLR